MSATGRAGEVMDQQDIERLWKRAADAITRAKFCANDSEVQAAAEAFKRIDTTCDGTYPVEVEWDDESVYLTLSKGADQ